MRELDSNFLSNVSVQFVLASLFIASAVSGLSIPSEEEVNPALLVDPIQEGNYNVTESPRTRSLLCRPNVPEPEFIPDLRECENYHICINGQSFPHTCDDDLIFNINRMRCSNVGRCLLDYEPICRQSNTALPHVHECRHYFFCAPGQIRPTLHTCRAGQLFDQNSSRCVPESEANCGNPPNDDLDPFPQAANM